MPGVFTRDTKSRDTQEEKARRGEAEAGIRSCNSRNSDSRRSWRRQGADAPREPLEGAQTCRHLGFGLPVSRPVIE